MYMYMYVIHVHVHICTCTNVCICMVLQFNQFSLFIQFYETIVRYEKFFTTESQYISGVMVSYDACTCTCLGWICGL